ncbi:MAG: ribbon-helix-helix domain-containing protein [Anaerolineae bacterium]
MNTVTVQAKVPNHLFEEIERLVQAGWFRDVDTLIGEALRRFLESHRAELMEQFIRQDVEWGLHGQE